MAAGLTAVLFALDREARPFRRGARRLPGIAPCPVWQKADGTVVVVTGMGAAAVELALDWLLEDWRYRPTRIVSAGFCGGLSPELQVGSLVRPAEVVDEAGHRWSLSDAPAGVRLVSISAPVLDVAGRRTLQAQSGASAADMETATVAARCQSAGLACLGLRVVSDGVNEPLPPEMNALLGGGRLRPAVLAQALLYRPGLAGDLWRLARHSRQGAVRLAEELTRLLAEPSRSVV